MATKVKPTRLQITGTPQAGQVPIYVNPDCFCWGSSGCQGTVIGPSSSYDGDIPLFCGTCGDCIIDSGEKLCDYAKCCDIPTDNCQLANGCGYQTTSCMVNDFSSPNCTTYPTTEAVCCYVGQKISGAYIYKGTVNTYEDLPTTGLTAGDVYNITTAHTTSPEFPAGANLAWTGSDWDVLGGLVDLSGKQDVLTAGPNITIASNVISGDFNFATSSTAAACTTKCVCIPEVTQLCVGQQITVKPSVTATNCATSLKLNDFTAYPIRFNNAALTSTTDGYVRGADCLTTFLFDGSYWQVASKSYDINTTYSLNTLYDAGKKTAGTGTYALSRYSLVMEKDDGTWEKITNTSASYTTATTKTVNTNGFRLNHIRYYNTTTNIATGALIATNTLSNQAASVDLRYSTNCGGTTTWAEGDYIYLVGKMGVDGLFYLDTTQRWTNTLPTTNDGKLYIRLGLVLAAASYTMSLLIDRPIFYYDNGIKEYKIADNKQDTLISGTNIKTINGCNLLGSGDICICGGGGTGDMEKCVYDPNNHNADAFDYCNFTNTPTIPTDNCQLANGCGYTTCTGTISTCSDITIALGYTPYNASNPCNYIENDRTGTTDCINAIWSGTAAEFCCITPDPNEYYIVTDAGGGGGGGGGGSSIEPSTCADGDLVISAGNTTCWADHYFMCAKEWNFNNLTICPGITVHFCGDDEPIIKVGGMFCNLGTIDTYGPKTQDCIDFLQNNIYALGMVDRPNFECCGGKGGYVDASNYGGAGGGMGENGCPNSFGCPGGTGTTYAGGGGVGRYSGCGGNANDACGGCGGRGEWGGGGGFGLVNGGVGGQGFCCPGDGGNAMYGTGGKGGSTCYCTGGKGGDSLYGTGGDGGDVLYPQSAARSGDGGRGYNGGNGGGGCCSSGNGGDAYNWHYGLTIIANDFYNCCINAGGGKGGNGSVGGGCPFGKGGNGGNGGNVTILYNNICNRGDINISGGKGGKGGRACSGGCRYDAGESGKDGKDGTLIILQTCL